MANTKTLHALITADAKPVEKEVARAEVAFKSLASSSAGLRAGLGALVGGADPMSILKGQAENLIGSIPGIGPGLQAGLGVAESFFGKIRETQKDIADQGKHALGLGATIEGYSKLRFAVSDVEALDRGLHHLNVAIVDAAMGNEEMGATFQRLGLDVNQLLNLPAEQRFKMFADAIRGVENSALRSHEAQKILGKGALALMGDLMKGSAGLDRLGEIGKEHGKVITTEDVASAMTFNAQMKQLNTEFEGIWRGLATGLAPVMASILDDVKALTGETGKFEISDKFKADLIEMKTGFTDAFHAAKGLFLGATLLDFSGAKEEFGKIVGPTKARELAEQQVAAWKDKTAAKAAELSKLEKQSAEGITAKVKAEKEAAELKKQQAEWEKEVQKVRDSAQTPLDKFQSQIDQINSVAASGALSWDQYAGALGHVVDEFEKLNKEKNEYRGTEALEFGTAAESSARARAAFDSNRAAESGQNRIESLLTQLRDHARDSKKANEEVAEYMRKIGLAKL